MEFRTIVDVENPGFRIEPCEEMLFVGSCFADNIGARFKEEKYQVVVNPFGVMYNPASILHTIERIEGRFKTVFLTLGTNHVYRLKETGPWRCAPAWPPSPMWATWRWKSPSTRPGIWTR